jgi:hypothetical protein
VQAIEFSNKTALSRELGVSRASLYYKRKLPEKDEALRRAIESVMQENPGYGAPRVAIDKYLLHPSDQLWCKSCEAHGQNLIEPTSERVNKESIPDAGRTPVLREGKLQKVKSY